MFCHELLDDTDAALKLAATAFTAAMAELDAVSDEDFTETTLVLQALRDCLGLWKKEGD